MLRLKKSKGSGTLLFGIFVILFMFMLGYLLYEEYTLEYKVEEVEDTLVASALGVEVLDSRTLALFQDMRFFDIQDAYSNLCKFIGKNLGIQQIESTNKFRSGNLFPEGYECVLTKAIFYEKIDSTGKWVITSYNDLGIKTRVEQDLSDNPVTPLNAIVVNSGLYVEFKFPIRVVGTDQWAVKGVYVNLERE